jgi:glycosyltransferase involved in cell wall biosynthesis
MVSSPVTGPPCTLSFCIPTYNRANTVIDLVLRLLQCPTPDIEVVVLDNGSTDDTVELLKGITDERLTVCSNGTNRGVIFNVVSVLLQGRGDYSVLLLDKDSIDTDLIPSFLDFLRRESPATGYCEYNLPKGTLSLLFAKGSDAVRNVAYKCNHPSGYFFRAADLHDIRVIDRFTDYDYVGNFPFEFIQAELCMRGTAAIYQESLFIPETQEAARATKSYSISGSNKDAYFKPKGRLKIAVNFSSHILSLPLASVLKRQLIFDRFEQGLRNATVGYRRIMANKAICEHHYITTRRVGRLELLVITIDFYFSFSRQLKSMGRDSATPTGVELLMDMALRLILRIATRLARLK